MLADGEPIKATGFAATKGGEVTGKFVATLPNKNATLSVIARSGSLTSAPASVKLIYDRPPQTAVAAPAAAPPPDSRPKLYALLVGVTNYEDKELNDIHFGARDAEGLADALERQKGRLYADVQTQIVDFPTHADFGRKVIGPPTRDSVFNGLYWLKRAATDNDLVVVFLSGHGYRDFSDPRQGFWFLTREAKIDELPTSAISGEDLYRQVSSLPGKKILFIDACHEFQATACVALLKSVGDKSVILEGRIAYESAKAAADEVIAGLTTALVQGGKPQDFPTIQADMEEAGRGLQGVCDTAVRVARSAEGTKGLLGGIVTEAVGPVIDALKATAGALWEHHVEFVKLERDMIERQLEAAKWPEFGQ